MRAPDHYDELAISIEPDGKKYKARILWSPFDGVEDTYSPPFDAEQVSKLLDQLESEVVYSGPAGPRPPSVDPPEVVLPVREVGERLFETLFRGELKEVFDSCWNVKQPGRKGLRLRLVFDPSIPEIRHLAALPWELLPSQGFSMDAPRVFKSPIVRHLQVRRFNNPLPAKLPLRVLIVSANPSNPDRPEPLEALHPLGLVQELRDIRDAWGNQLAIHMEWLDHASPGRLYDFLERNPVHILHFIGHSHFDDASGVGVLLFEDDNGKERFVSGQELANWLGERDVRLVVLNSCETARASARLEHSPYTGVAPALAIAGVTAVIANQFPISNSAAIKFSAELYKSLAVGESVESAVTAGRVRIMLDQPKSLEWATPVLFMRLQDGRIFDFVKDPEAEQRRRSEVRKLGIRTFQNQHERMEDEIPQAANLKCLLEYFDTEAAERKRWRRLRPGFSWQETIFPEIREFLGDRTRKQRNVYLHMDAHSSVAFAAGYCLDTQSGASVTIRQRTLLGIQDWKPDLALTPFGQLWKDEADHRISEDGDDVAIAISVTHDVFKDVKAYVEGHLPRVGRIMIAKLYPRPNSTGLRDGTHAFHLAQTLKDRLQTRTAEEHNGTLHIFGAAPNALFFFLGQHSRTLGNTVLYEYGMETGKLGDYSPSLGFPPPEPLKSTPGS